MPADGCASCKRQVQRGQCLTRCDSRDTGPRCSRREGPPPSPRARKARADANMCDACLFSPPALSPVCSPLQGRHCRASARPVQNRPGDKTCPLIGRQAAAGVSAERESSNTINRQKLCEHEVPCPSKDGCHTDKRGSANQGKHSHAGMLTCFAPSYRSRPSAQRTKGRLGPSFRTIAQLFIPQPESGILFTVGPLRQPGGARSVFMQAEASSTILVQDIGRAQPGAR